jgi:hypothetical protein
LACQNNTELPTLNAADWFGNALELRYAIDQTPANEAAFPPSETPDKVFRRSDLELFIENIHEPSLDLVTEMLAKRDITPVRGFQLLAAPATAVATSRARLLEPTAGGGRLRQQRHTPAPVQAAAVRYQWCRSRLEGFRTRHEVAGETAGR